MPLQRRAFLRWCLAGVPFYAQARAADSAKLTIRRIEPHVLKLGGERQLRRYVDVEVLLVANEATVRPGRWDLADAGRQPGDDDRLHDTTELAEPHGRTTTATTIPAGNRA